MFWTKFWQNCITLVDTWIQRWHPRARDQWEGLDCWSCLCKLAPEICSYESTCSFMHTCTSVIILRLFQQLSFCGFECSMEASVTCVMTRTLEGKKPIRSNNSAQLLHVYTIVPQEKTKEVKHLQSMFNHTYIFILQKSFA